MAWLRTGFVALVALTVTVIYFSCVQLPDQVAVNFNLDGDVTVYNQRDIYRFLVLFVAGTLPFLVFAGMVLMPRFITQYVFLPNRDYWLSEDRRAETDRWTEKFGLVTSGLVSLFWLWLHAVNLRASSLEPPHYEFWSRVLLLTGWVAFIVMAGRSYHKKFNYVPS